MAPMQLQTFYVVGTPLGHTLSPRMHNAAFEAAQCPYTFEAYDPADEGGFLHWCDEVAYQRNRGQGVGGFCTTIPYKQLAYRHCDVLGAAARGTGAVNVVTRTPEGDLRGDNTDALGFVAALRFELAAQGCAPLSADTTALVAGTGGVARALVWALINEGVCSIVLSSRSREKAQLFAESFRDFATEKHVELIPVQEAMKSAGERFDIVVNATPLGLSPSDAAFASPEWLKQSARFVFDAVYSRTSTTPLIVSARQLGIACCDGRRMLVEQGIAAQDIWNDVFGFWDSEETKQRAIDAMRAAIMNSEQ